MQTQQKPEVFQSKWGYHPVSYEDFQILRVLHKYYWRAYFQAARWVAWARKAPHNRHGNEPFFNEHVFNKLSALISAEECASRNRRLDISQLMPVWRPFTNIVEDFRKARFACVSPRGVDPIDMQSYKWLFNRLLAAGEFPYVETKSVEI